MAKQQATFTVKYVAKIKDADGNDASQWCTASQHFTLANAKRAAKTWKWGGYDAVVVTDGKSAGKLVAVK